jgi:hypothetical protein
LQRQRLDPPPCNLKHAALASWLEIDWWSPSIRHHIY